GTIISMSPATSPVMPYDPNHEYPDVDLQLSLKEEEGNLNPPMGGFITSAWEVARSIKDACRVMQYFTRQASLIERATSQALVMKPPIGGFKLPSSSLSESCKSTSGYSWLGS